MNRNLCQSLCYLSEMFFKINERFLNLTDPARKESIQEIAKRFELKEKIAARLCTEWVANGEGNEWHQLPYLLERNQIIYDPGFQRLVNVNRSSVRYKGNFNCYYASGSNTLHCAVHPTKDSCKDCPDFRSR